MVIQFKKTLFLNFGYNQTLETLWRMALQLEQHWEKKTTPQAVLALQNAVNFLQDHPDNTIAQLHSLLQKYLPLKDIERVTHFAMQIERLLQKELKDPDFLVTTKDTNQQKGKQLPIHLVLDNLRSAYNVGSLFRSAEALGVLKIHLCGLTPTPENTKTSRTALGSDQWIEWQYHPSTLDCLHLLHTVGITSYALETSPQALPLPDIEIAPPCALILGNERYGVPQHVLRECHNLVAIPLIGRKNSLNVGVCGGIALYHFCSFLS